MNVIAPDTVQKVAAYEDRFNTTIARSGKTVLQRVAESKPLELTDTEALAQVANPDYTLPIFGATGSNWVLPMGAYSTESAGAI